MKPLLHYLKDYKKESILGPLFKLLEASFELLVPLVMASIIDIGIKETNLSYVWKMAILLVTLGIVGLACSITAQYFAARASVGFGTQLRKDLFHHINSLSYKELDEIGTSTLITRITNDINLIQNAVNLFLRLFLRSPFIVFGSMIMAFTVNAKAAFIFVIAIPALSLVVFGIMLLTMPLYKKVQKKLDNILLSTRENLIGVRVIRAFCRQDKEIENFKNISDSLLSLQVHVSKISSLLNPLTYILVNASLIMILWIGSHQVNSGIILQGDMIALVSYMSAILIELIKLVNLIITFSKALACAKRVQEVFSIHSSIQEPLAPEDTDTFTGNIAVSFEDVSFSYHEGQEHALEHLTFSVMKNETIGIIGGTGAGKSTLANLIPRFYDASSGRIRINGLDITKYSLSGLRHKIGVVPQKAVLFKGSIRDNLTLGCQNADESQLYKALEIAQALEIVQSKPEGLDHMISQGGKNLSGGQKQRLTIARALVREPEILILDDSASALDFVTDSKLRKAIAGMHRQMTVFMISQRVSTIKNADRILVLDDGKMTGYGTHEELIGSCEVYREIYFSQQTGKEAV